MAEKRMFAWQEKMVPGESIPFESKGEQWSYYDLEDGSKAKIKVVLMDIVRLEAHMPNGDPVYMITAQQVVGVDVNPELKQKVN